jgi:hypothetical protein
MNCDVSIRGRILHGAISSLRWKCVRYKLNAMHIASIASHACDNENYWDADELGSFWPLAQAAMACQSGSSFDSNCRPPPWTSPPAIGDRGWIRKRLFIGSEWSMSRDTFWKILRDCSSSQEVAPGESFTRYCGPVLDAWQA